MKQPKIGIIGAGEIGQAIGSLFPKQLVHFWDRDLKKVKNGSMEDVVKDADLIFLCVPSWAVKEVLPKLKPMVSKNTVGIISLAKGVAKPTGMTMDEILSKYFDKNRFGILAGPMLAEEIMKKGQTMGVLATKNPRIYKTFKRLAKTNFFTLHYSTDVQGAALAGVIKNVYAVALGMADCLGLGHNTRAWLFTQMMKEMQMAAKVIGGKTETFLGLAGLGDLVATGSSSDSRHFTVGRELIKYGKCTLSNEGLNSLPVIWKKVARKKADFPVIEMLHKIVAGKSNAKKTFLAYINNA